MYFDFVLPRNTKQKSLNMVLNSNDRFHNQEKGKITRRIRNFAYWHTSISKDKKRAAFSPSNPCEVVVTVCSPTKSKLDPPNLYPTVKAIIDGMTDAGIWTDDNYKVIKAITFVKVIAYNYIKDLWQHGHGLFSVDIAFNAKYAEYTF